MRAPLRSHDRALGNFRLYGWMSILSGVGMLVWGGLLFGFFNGYLESTEFQRGAQVVLGTTGIAFLVAVVGVYDSFVRSRLSRVILGGMGVVSLGMFLGAALAVFTLELGATVMVASFILVVAGGTLLGLEFLRSGGPRAAAWSLAISGPLFLLTDKLLWEPLNALLGVDITAFLTTVPFAVGMVLLGRVLIEQSMTVESEHVGAEND